MSRKRFFCPWCGEVMPRDSVESGGTLVRCPTCDRDVPVSELVGRGGVSSRAIAVIGLGIGVVVLAVLLLPMARSWSNRQAATDSYRRGLAALEDDDYDLAIECFTEAIRLGLHDAAAYALRGHAYSEKGEFDKAVSDFTEAIRLEPDDAAAYFLRGSAYFEKGEFDNAVSDFTEAIRLDPKLAAAYTGRGGAYLNMGEYDRAIADSCEAIRLDPTHAMAYNNRGGAYLNKGKLDEAIADCSQAIRLDPNLALAHQNRGRAYSQKGDTDKAMADYAEAIRCEPENAGGYFGRGVAFCERDMYDEAVADFTEAIHLAPGYEQAWCNRGSARFAKGQYDEALADYSQALELDPRDGIALVQRFTAATGARLKRQPVAPTNHDRQTSQPEPEREPPESPPEEDDQREPSPPPARRVAARALVFAAIVYRSGLEAHARSPDAEELRGRSLVWIDALGLSSELEEAERDFLETPVGQADPQTAINGSWRSEGLAVLAWALKRYELPPYDQGVDLLTAAASVGFLDNDRAGELLVSAALRPSSEVDRLAAHATIVNWRLTQFSLAPEPMDFSAYLQQHPAYKEYWLDGLRFVEGDLAIGDASVADVNEDQFGNCRSTAVERQTAAYWLQGDREIYSEVSADTILTGL